MNMAVGIGAMLLGSWVLNTQVDEAPPDAKSPPPAGVVAAPVMPALSPEFSPTIASAENPAEQPDPRMWRRPRNENPERIEPREQVKQRDRELKHSGNKPAQAYRNEQGKRVSKEQAAAEERAAENSRKRPGAVMPQMPTETSRPGMIPMPSAPTARDEDLDSRPVPADPYADPTTQNTPQVPTSRRALTPRTSDTMSTYSMADQMRQATEAAAHPAFAPTGPASKAFATARPFSSGVSPYMNLFRNDTNGGTIDNYTTFVRPAINQQSLNQQFNMDVYGLQRNAQIQNAALQQMNRGVSRAPQGVGTPQFYMNYGNYYPGFGGGFGQGAYGQGGN
jgi:hypothetical protein